MRSNILTITGAPGSGKTRALRALIENAVNRGERVVAVDTRGDLDDAYRLSTSAAWTDVTQGHEIVEFVTEQWRVGTCPLLIITCAVDDRAGELTAAVTRATNPPRPTCRLWLVIDDVTSIAPDVRAELMAVVDTLPPGSTVVLAGTEAGGWAGQ